MPFEKGHSAHWLGKRFSEEHRRAISEANKKSVAVKAHMKELNISQRGEGHPNWKGGTHAISNRIRSGHSQEWENWRHAVLTRDGFKCTKCNRNNIEIYAHHIKPLVSLNDLDLAFDVSNGVAICRSCHKKEHPEIGIITRFRKGEARLNRLVE